MSGRRSEGRLLFVHADDPEVTVAFAGRYLHDNQRLLSMTMPLVKAVVHDGFDREIPYWDASKKRNKMADVKGPRSLVVADLTEIAARAAPTDSRPRPVALTVYLLSNSGQGPSLEMYDVPSGVVSFVRRAAGARTASAWKAVSGRFRPVKETKDGEDGDAGEPKRSKKRTKASPPIAGKPGWSRNPAFEDLCDVFESGFTDRRKAAEWLRRHVLGRITARKGPDRYDATGARSWALAELFLKEVMGMKAARIEAVRAFADKLATRIHEKGDGKLFKSLAFDKPRELRHRLLAVQRESAKDALLFGLDEYATVWLHEDGDEWLVRDLVCIRVVERLHELGYFAEHPEEVLDEAPDQDEKDEDEEAGE
jgi:hypothetical protein